MPDNNELQLVQVAESTGLEKNKVQILLEKFSSSFAEAKKLSEGAKEIRVTAEDQVEEMQKARALRISLKNVRTDVEKNRKELKEQSLREGRAIDGMANIIKALIVPIEEHLEAQENFAEKQKELRNDKVEQDRVSELSKYVSGAEVYKLHPTDMSKDTFNQLLKTSKIAFEAQEKAKKEAEEAKVAREAEEKEEQERIRKENESLKKDQELREKEVAKERAEMEKKLKAEREVREKLENDKLAKEKAELKEKERLEAEAKKDREAEEAKKRQEMTAPDKEKLLKLADDLENNFKLPSFNSVEAQQLAHEVLDHVNNSIKFIRESAAKLGE